MRLAAWHPAWVLGFADETCWSRLALPAPHSWTEGKFLRLIEQVPRKGNPELRALCCYGLLRIDRDDVLLRFVDGRPVSHVTTAFLEGVCEQLAPERRQVLVLIRGNASGHLSQEVCRWILAHNQRAKQHGSIRLITCRLPVKSPWLNTGLG